MTTYTAISNAAVAVGAIPSSSLVTAFRDNPIAISESATGAPIIAAAWHPYDKVSVGDGATGLIFDAAVNTGISTVTTPNFANGWEYKVLFRSVGYTSAGPRNLLISLDGTTQVFSSSSVANSSLRISGDVEILNTRVNEANRLVWGADSGATAPVSAYTTTNTIWTNATITWSGSNVFSAGKIYLLRRRDYRSV